MKKVINFYGCNRTPVAINSSRLKVMEIWTNVLGSFKSYPGLVSQIPCLLMPRTCLIKPSQ
jgi:hypothetical protein